MTTVYYVVKEPAKMMILDIVFGIISNPLLFIGVTGSVFLFMVLWQRVEEWGTK